MAFGFQGLNLPGPIEAAAVQSDLDAHKSFQGLNLPGPIEALKNLLARRQGLLFQGLNLPGPIEAHEKPQHKPYAHVIPGTKPPWPH